MREVLCSTRHRSEWSWENCTDRSYQRSCARILKDIKGQIISKYLLNSQSVTAFSDCLHSHSRVRVKCSTKSEPSIVRATSDDFICCVASYRFVGSVP